MLFAPAILFAEPTGGREKPERQKTLRFAAGLEGTLYHEVAKAIAKAVESKHPDIRIIIAPTGGSAENARMVAENRADLAIVQSNTAGEDLSTNPDIVGLVSLYTEAFQVFTLGNKPTSSIDDFRGQRIYIGQQGSGTKEDARRFLRTLGVQSAEYQAVVEPFQELPALIERNEIDGGILVSGVPSRRLAMVQADFSLVPLSNRQVRELLDQFEYLAEFDIPAGTYKHQRHDVRTVSVRALLVCRRSMEETAVRDILSAAANAPRVRELASKYGEMITPLNQLRRGMSLDIHPAASSFFRTRILLTSLRTEMLPDLIIMLVVLLSWAVVLLAPATWARALRRNVYAQLSAAFLTIYLVATVVIHISEYGVTPGFDSIGESFWSSIVYVLSGLDTSPPATIAGRAGVALLLIATSAMFASIIGKFAIIFMKHNEHKMPDNISRHFVICNWNSRVDGLIKELHASEAEPDTDIVVLSASEGPENESLRQLARAEDSRIYRRVYFVHQNPESHDALKRVRAHQAKSIVILIDEQSPDPDGHTALIALAVRTVCNEAGLARDTQPRIVAETSNHNKMRHVKDAGADEIVCPSDYELGVLAQSCINGQVADVYQQLLHFSEETSEVYVLPAAKLPHDVVGAAFRDIARAVLASASSHNPCIPIGIRRRENHGYRMIVNPGYGKEAADFLEGDELIVIAHTSPDLSTLQL